jgi:tRNA(fMet)-specific endonuclease VapC
MAIMLDTDVIIAGERGTLDLERWLNSQAGEEFEIAAITVAELWHGVERASSVHRKRRIAYLEAITAVLAIIPYTEQTAFEHARIWAHLELSGKMIGFYDVIVAATASERGSTIATFNRKHFTQVKGLKIIDPH